MKLKYIIVLLAIAFVAWLSYKPAWSETNTVTSTVVSTNNTPPTANSPSVMANNIDLCHTGYSGSVQTLRLGVSSGNTMVDETCQLLKLSKTLFSMQMRVAAISLMASDCRVWDALYQASTYPPYRGKIGAEAKEAWENEAIHMIPDCSKLKPMLMKEYWQRKADAKAAAIQAEEERVAAIRKATADRQKLWFKNLFKKVKLKK